MLTWDLILQVSQEKEPYENFILKILHQDKVCSFHQILFKLSQNVCTIIRIVSFQIGPDLSSIIGKGAVWKIITKSS